MANLFPPFDPDDSPRSARIRQLRQIPIRWLIPNLITLLALCVGLTAVRMALEGRFKLAVINVIGAAILDGLDGRMARFLKSTSRFGAQLDSLTDFVNFGVAPAVVLFAFTLKETGAFGWTAALIFAICSALRLARFNVAMEGPTKPAWQSDFFIGVPAPAAAGIALLPLYLEFLGIPHVHVLTTGLVWVYTVAVALLMVSRLPTWSGKSLGTRIPRDMVLPILIAVVVFVAFLVSFPWQVLAICSLAYLALLPLGLRAYERLEAADPAASTPAPQPASGPGQPD